MPRFDFECQEGHQFVLWSDSARMCPECGSEYLKRIFVTAPAVTSGKTSVLDKMVQTQLDNMGITNLTQRGEGESAKVDYKSTPEQLAANKVLEDFPAAKVAPSQFASLHKAVSMHFQNTGGVKAVINSGIGKTREARQVTEVIRSLKNPQYRPQTVVLRNDNTRKVVWNRGTKRAQVRHVPESKS